MDIYGSHEGSSETARRGVEFERLAAPRLFDLSRHALAAVAIPELDSPWLWSRLITLARTSISRPCMIDDDEDPKAAQRFVEDPSARARATLCRIKITRARLKRRAFRGGRRTPPSRRRIDSATVDAMRPASSALGIGGICRHSDSRRSRPSRLVESRIGLCAVRDLHGPQFATA